MAVSQRDVSMRKKNGNEVTLAIGQCIPITPGLSIRGGQKNANVKFELAY